MKRPSFQFYPADWRNNAKLRRCSAAARGAWMDVLCVLHDSDEYGVCRWPLADLANAAGVAIKWLRELIEKDVLKGADSGAVDFIYAPRHAGKDGEPVTLVKAGNGPCWYCTRFVRDEWIRGRRGIGSRFDSENQPGRNSDGGVKKTSIDSFTNPTNGYAPTGAPTRRVGERVGVNGEKPISSLFDEKSQNFEEKTSIDALPQLEIDIAASIENITKNAEPTRRVGERLGYGPTSTSTTTKIKTKTNTKKNIQKKTPEPNNPDAFEKFWAAYPKKQRKPSAIIAFNDLNPDEELLETILGAIEKGRASDDWKKAGGKFILGPVRYLNEEGWNDVIDIESKPDKFGWDAKQGRHTRPNL